jgi:hypothetical protein
MHDVSLVDKTSGDFLKYNGTLWVNDQINLGTDTVGNYMSGLSAGAGLTVSHTPGEGSSASVSLNATLDDLSNVTVPTPTSGDFLKWDGSAWVNAVIPSSGATVSETPPSSPTTGQVWYESDTGKTFVYYDSFWIEIVGSTGAQGPAGATGATGPATTDASLLVSGSLPDARLSSAIARIDSPTFTGIPSAPTASAGNNSTQIATTAYADAAVAAIVDSAPATLNTLDELAAALGDDTNFATTTATAIGLKAPLASPTFTGTPTLPTGTIATTQTSGNNTTAVATTAFVATAVSSLPRGVVAYVRQESGGGSLNSMGGGIISLTGSTTTFTPVAGRLYRCSYSIGSITQPAYPDAIIINLLKGGSSTLDISNLFESTTNIVSHTRVITLTSSQLGTSATNLSLSVQTNDSVTVTNSSTRPTIIIVEDIGLA